MDIGSVIAVFVPHIGARNSGPCVARATGLPKRPPGRAWRWPGDALHAWPRPRRDMRAGDPFVKFPYICVPHPLSRRGRACPGMTACASGRVGEIAHRPCNVRMNLGNQDTRRTHPPHAPAHEARGPARRPAAVSEKLSGRLRVERKRPDASIKASAARVAAAVGAGVLPPRNRQVGALSDRAGSP